MFIYFRFWCCLFLNLRRRLTLARQAPTKLAEAMGHISPAKATAIIEFSERNGSYDRMEALVKVRGIGRVAVEANREDLG